MSLSKWNAILEERSRKWKKCLSITSWKANIEMAFRPTTSNSRIKIPDHSYQKLHTTRLTSPLLPSTTKFSSFWDTKSQVISGEIKAHLFIVNLISRISVACNVFHQLTGYMELNKLIYKCILINKGLEMDFQWNSLPSSVNNNGSTQWI